MSTPRRLGRNKVEIDPLARANEVYATDTALTTTGREELNGQGTEQSEERIQDETSVEATSDGTSVPTPTPQSATTQSDETSEDDGSKTTQKKTRTVRGKPPPASQTSETGIKKEALPPTPLATPLDATAIVRQVKDRRHLSANTFRFQSKELDEIERLYKLVLKDYPDTLSKNDIARLMVILVSQDFEMRGEASLFGQVIARL